MAKVKIQGHASGTGILTVTAPNTSTDRTITLPDATGTLATTDINSFTGDTTITSGDIVFATAGKGIVLGSTTNTDANTLEDYEEGTFTPVARDASSGGNTHALSVADGTYTKIGRVVNFRFSVAISSSSGVTGTYFYISGLPFTHQSVGSGFYTPISTILGNATLTGTPNFQIASSAAYGYIRQTESGGAGTNLTVSQMGTGWINVSGSYQTS